MKKLLEAYRIVLASASPRRREILEKLGLEFEVCPSNKEEAVESTVPSEVCLALSRQKALDVASGIRLYNEAHPEITTPQDILVIGADTVVASPITAASDFSAGKSLTENKKQSPGKEFPNHPTEILGKPKDPADALRMLKLLQGRTHSVFTGVTFVFLSKDGRAGEYSFFEETAVTLYPISDSELQAYIETGEPFDKAGAYGIQGEFFRCVKGICGDYYNVVGLPAARMYQELKTLL